MTDISKRLMMRTAQQEAKQLKALGEPGQDGVLQLCESYFNANPEPEAHDFVSLSIPNGDR